MVGELPTEAVLIDGAVPRSPRKRVEILIDELRSYRDDSSQYRWRDNDTTGEALAAYYRLKHEVARRGREETRSGEEFEFWNEIEDDILVVLNSILPEPWMCTLAEDEPGTVLVRNG